MLHFYVIILRLKIKREILTLFILAIAKKHNSMTKKGVKRRKGKNIGNAEG